MREASLASTLDLGQRSAAAAANVAAVAAISKTASPLATTTANNNRRAMQRPILAGAPIANSLSADLVPLVSDNAPPLAVEAANTLASDRQTMLISLRGDAPTANLRPGKCCRRESTAADEQTGETRWELASKLDLGKSTPIDTF